MKTFCFGFIVRILISTVGFSGLVRIIDNSVDAVKVHGKNLSKWKN